MTNGRTRNAAQTVALLLMARGALLSAGEIKTNEREDGFEVTTPHYTASVLRASGMLEMLQPTGSDVSLLSAFRIYTDYGFYPRGHVGTRFEEGAEVSLRREENEVVVTGSGHLRGEPAQDAKLIAYRVEYRFDGTKRIRITCAVTLPERKEKLNAFLALCFSIPRLREWAANTIDGVVREDARTSRSRNLDSAREPIDPSQPFVELTQQNDRMLRVSEIEWRPQELTRSVIVHSTTLFLAWLSGGPFRAEAQTYTLKFVLEVR